MKKILFILSLMLCAMGGVYAQSSTTYNFHYLGDPSCPDWYGWEISHGCPIYADVNNAKFICRSDNDYLSDGLFANHNFSKNHKYQFLFVFNGIGGNEQPHLEAYGANGLVANKNPKCFQAVLPNVPDRQLIDCITVKNGLLYEVTTPTWYPNKNYNYFWITSNYPYAWTSYFLINRIVITECELPPPPMPVNLHATIVEAKKIKAEWSPSTGAAKYEVFLNGNSQGNTTNTGYTFTGLKECTSYKIEVRASDQCGDYSDKASITVKTMSDLPIDIVLQDPINLSIQPNKKYIAQALNSVTLKPGFSVKANDAQEYFHARISSGCGDVLLSVFPDGEEESFFTIEDDNFSITSFPEPDSTPHLTLPSEAINSDPLIYPNPTSNTIIVEYQQYTGAEKITIFDIMGKPLLNYELSGVMSNIDMSAFPSGIYFIKIITKDHVFVKKLIKQ